MKGIRSLLLAGAVLASTAFTTVPATAQVQLAQYSPPFGCRAINGYGSWGTGSGYTPDQASNAALRFCARNAPYNTTCYVVRWWQSY